MDEDRMTLDKVIFLVRKSLLNQNVTNSVSNFGADRGNFNGEDIEEAYLQCIIKMNYN